MKKHYEALDAMRGLAALAVVLYHIGGETDAASVTRGSYDFAPSGYLAVDLFFVLSGFVVCNVYAPRFGPDYGSWEFVKARLIRLYPLYLAGLLISAPIRAVEILKHFGSWTGWSLGKLALSVGLGLAFLPTPPIAANAGDFKLYPYNVPFWSLFFELIASFAFLFLRRWAAKALTGLVAVGFAGLTLAVLMRGDASLGTNWETFGGGLARVSFSFTVGMLLTRVKPADWKGAPGVCFLLAPACMLAPVPAAIRPVYDIACIALVFPCAVWCGIGCEVRWKSAASYLGAISYAVYALHRPLLQVIIGGLKLTHLPVLGPVLAIASTSVAVAVAAVAHHVWDVPVRRWLTARTRPGTKRPGLARAA